MAKKWVLLDRDGTIIVDKEYLCDPKGVELLPGAAEGLKRLYDAGYILTVVSNQSGVGRGYFTGDDVVKVNAMVCEILQRRGVVLSGIYFCPHAPDEKCHCRKPKTGLVACAMRDLGMVRDDIVCVVGDKDSDMELARNLGVQGVLVGTADADGIEADHYCKDLSETADWLIQKERGNSGK